MIPSVVSVIDREPLEIPRPRPGEDMWEFVHRLNAQERANAARRAEESRRRREEDRRYWDEFLERIAANSPRRNRDPRFDPARAHADLHPAGVYAARATR